MHTNKFFTRRCSFQNLPVFLIALAMFLAAPRLHAAEEAIATNDAPEVAATSNAVDRAKIAADSKDAVYDDIAVFTEALMTVKRQYVEEKTYRELINGAINGMLVSLDPHSGFLPPSEFQELRDETSGHFSGIGIHVGIKDGRVVVIAPIEGSPAARAGVMSGDRLSKIDHVSALGISMDEAVRRLRGAKGSPVVVTIDRDGRDPFDVTLLRDDIKVASVKGTRVLRDNVGYIRIVQFGEGTAAEFATALEKLQEQKVTALVVDLRDNPGGLLNSVTELVGTLLPKNADIVSVRGRDGVRVEEQYRAEGSKHLTDMPLTILINARSASAAEIMAGALQDHHRAVIVGETSFGKASVQNILRLTTRTDSALRLTTAHYFTPAGRMIHGKGIQPDITINTPLSKWRAILLKRAYDEFPEAYPAATREKVDDVEDTQLTRAVDVVIGARVLETKPDKK